MCRSRHFSLCLGKYLKETEENRNPGGWSCRSAQVNILCRTQIFHICSKASSLCRLYSRFECLAIWTKIFNVGAWFQWIARKKKEFWNFVQIQVTSDFSRVLSISFSGAKIWQKGDFIDDTTAPRSGDLKKGLNMLLILVIEWISMTSQELWLRKGLSFPSVEGCQLYDNSSSLWQKWLRNGKINKLDYERIWERNSNYPGNLDS